MQRQRTRRPLSERFWEKVQKTDGCWLWTGNRHPKGYGYISEGGRAGSDLRAHRVAWELTYGPIPAGLWVRHKCDTPPCVRPDHLELGTAAENSRDMVERGRSCHAPNPPERTARGERHSSVTHPERIPRGERHTFAKFTDAQVLSLRQRWRAGGVMQKDLAAEFGVTKSVMSELLAGKTWKHLL